VEAYLILFAIYSIKVTIVHPDALSLHEERHSFMDYQHTKSWHLVQQEKHTPDELIPEFTQLAI
jgi:type II secretory pathway component PulL